MIEQNPQYENSIENMLSLSGLFSDSKVPNVNYRFVENAFCRFYGAENISREDCSFDAILNVNNENYGVGIKTFMTRCSDNGLLANKREKIAEFNKKGRDLHDLDPLTLAKTVSAWRNERIISSMKKHDTSKMMYHCVIRFIDQDGSSAFTIVNMPYLLVDLDNISLLKDEQYELFDTRRRTSVMFTDGMNEYSFVFSKNTMYQVFRPSAYDTIKKRIRIIEDPYFVLSNIDGIKRNLS